MSSDDSPWPGVGRVLESADRLPLTPGFLGGIVAFLGGYVLFVGTLATSGNPDFSSPLRTLRQIGGIFYNAHNIDLLRHREIVVGDQTIPQEATINLIQQTDPTLPRIAYYAIPVVALAIVAAVLLDRHVDAADPVGTVSAIVVGTTFGYVLAAMVGTVLVTQRTSMEGASETLGPVLMESLAFGVAYPLAITTLLGVTLLVVRHREALTTRVGRSQA